MRAEELRLEGHEVAVPGREVDEHLKAEVAPDGEAHGDGAHAHPGHGAVADVDEIGAGVADERSRLDGALDAHAAGRIDLDADDEATAGQSRRQAGRWRRRDCRPLIVGGRPHSPRRSTGGGRLTHSVRRARRAVGLAAARQPGTASMVAVEGLTHRGHVLRGRAAAATHEPSPGGKEARHLVGEVAWRGSPHELAAHTTSQPGVGHDDERRLTRGTGHLPEHVDGGDGPRATVHAERIDASGMERRRCRGGGRAVRHAEVLTEAQRGE